MASTDPSPAALPMPAELHAAVSAAYRGIAAHATATATDGRWDPRLEGAHLHLRLLLAGDLAAHLRAQHGTRVPRTTR